MIFAGWGLVALGVLIAAPAPINAEERFVISAIKLFAGIALIVVGVNLLAP